MSKLSSVLSCIVSRRCYGVQARALKVHVPAGRADGAAMAVAAEEGGRVTKKDGVFWMRDPRTGCWIPENRFDEVDAVELRDRLLHYN